MWCWAIEHSQWTVWCLTTMVPEWLCCHASTTGLGVISSGPWELSNNDNIRLFCLSLKKWMLGHSLHGESGILYTLQVVVITLYSLVIMCTLCWTGWMVKVLKDLSWLQESFSDPFCYFLMNSWIMQEPYTWRPPDHDSIIASVIWTKTFSVSNLLQKAHW